MNEKINKLIPVAMQAIKDSGMFEEDRVPKEFKGYISSMGASIIQAGLLATLAFYANDEGKKAKSSYLLKAIYQVVKGEKAADKNALIRWVIDSSLRDECRLNNNNEVGIDDMDLDKMYLLEKEIADALVALKLALRTFKISE